MIPLQHASAEEVARQLELRVPAGVTLDALAVPGVNGILLRGSPDDCDRLEAEIRRLDRSAGD
jgi:Tfp pilus assembly protein PilN